MKKVIIVLTAALATMAALAFGASEVLANGNNNGPQFGGSSSSTSSSISSAVAAGVGIGGGGVGIGGGGGSGGSGSASASASTGKNLAIGLGSTGLTSTAQCLGSRAVLFNAVADTYVVESCVLRYYAERICPTTANEWECNKVFACADPDLADQAKKYLGCPKAPE